MIIGTKNRNRLFLAIKSLFGRYYFLSNTVQNTLMIRIYYVENKTLITFDMTIGKSMKMLSKK
jgi:hypothetical protein